MSFAEQLQAFRAARDGNVVVEVERKARYGKGGLLDYLRSAKPVAPTVLPDLVALDVVELEKAVAAGVLQPLDPLLDNAVTGALYPFAREAGQFDGQLYAVQFLGDIGHAAYLTSQMDDPPTQWSHVLADRDAYLFPLAVPPGGSSGWASENLSHAVIGQYLSAGGVLTADRRLALASQPLLQLLTFYQSGAAAGLLPSNSQELADGDAVWSVFVQGHVPLAYVSARRFRVENGVLSAGFVPAPGSSGAATEVASGWALAVVTADPERQRAAADFITWLITPENAAAWASASGWLPTSREAVQLLDPGPYGEFLDARLSTARALPTGPDYATTAERIQTAILAVVKGEKDASTAAADALASK